MNKSRMVTAAIAAGLLSLTVAACDNMSGSRQSSGRGESVGEYIDDATISTKVRAKLIDDKDLNLTQIDVTTDHGVVLITGVVDDAAKKAKATAVAADTSGVRSVRNELVIRRN
ncbi:MAG: BON domain-containing protein [Alphaproteobacteria bacterium]